MVFEKIERILEFHGDFQGFTDFQRIPLRISEIFFWICRYGVQDLQSEMPLELCNL